MAYLCISEHLAIVHIIDVNGLLYELKFSRISRVKSSRKFPLQFMSIYSNDNISKIAQINHSRITAPGPNRENNCTRK